MQRISPSLCTAPAFPQRPARRLRRGLAGTGEFRKSFVFLECLGSERRARLWEEAGGGNFPDKRHPGRVGAGDTAAGHSTFLLPPAWTVGTIPGLTQSSSVPDGSRPCLGLTWCLPPSERDGGESIFPRACRKRARCQEHPRPRLPQLHLFHREIFSPDVRALEVQHPRGFPASVQRIQEELFFHSRQERALSSFTFTGTFACSWRADSCRCGTTDVRGLSAPLLHRNIREQARA